MPNSASEPPGSGTRQRFLCIDHDFRALYRCQLFQAVIIEEWRGDITTSTRRTTTCAASPRTSSQLAPERPQGEQSPITKEVSSGGIVNGSSHPYLADEARRAPLRGSGGHRVPAPVGQARRRTGSQSPALCRRRKYGRYRRLPQAAPCEIACVTRKRRMFYAASSRPFLREAQHLDDH